MSKISWEQFKNVSESFAKLQMIRDIKTGDLKNTPLLNVQVAGVAQIILPDDVKELSEKLHRNVKKNDEALRLKLEAEEEKIFAAGEAIIDGFTVEAKKLLYPEPEVTVEPAPAE